MGHWAVKFSAPGVLLVLGPLFTSIASRCSSTKRTMRVVFLLSSSCCIDDGLGFFFSLSLRLRSMSNEMVSSSGTCSCRCAERLLL